MADPPATSRALQLRQAKKNYGDVVALQSLDMTVDEGEVYGFLGRNGAGKSTAMRIIMGITKPDGGSVTLFGEAVAGDDPTQRRHVGYVAQEQNFYPWMTAQRIGRFVSSFYPTWDDGEFTRLLKVLDIPLNRKLRGFSGGMHTKLALAMALAHRPRLLLLDEPTAGMDAVARREFIDIVRDQAERAHRTTVFSSHLIDEIEAAADRVGIVDDGQMRYEGSTQELQRSVRRFVLNSQDAGACAVPDIVSVGPAEILRDQTREGRRELVVRFPQGAEPPRFLDGPWFVEQPTLEDTFVAMVSKIPVV
jgi:ABC-2 type transport system ATP-binding protein